MFVTVQGIVTRSVQARKHVRLPRAQNLTPGAVQRDVSDPASAEEATQGGLLLNFERCTAVAERLFLVGSARRRAIALGADLAFHELDEFPGKMPSQEEVHKVHPYTCALFLIDFTSNQSARAIHQTMPVSLSVRVCVRCVSVSVSMSIRICICVDGDVFITR